MSKIKQFLPMASLLIALLSGCHRGGTAPAMDRFALPVSSDDIVLLGDDYLENGLWQEIYDTPRIKNRSLRGAGIDAVSAAARSLGESAPAKLFVSAGIQDFLQAKPQELEALSDHIVRETHLLFKRFHRRSPRTELYWLSIVPRPEMDLSVMEAIEQTNKALVEKARRSGLFTVVPADRILADGLVSGDYSYTEGNWLNASSYAHLATALTPYLGMPSPRLRSDVRFSEEQFGAVRIWRGTTPLPVRASGYYLDKLSQFLSLPRGRGGVVLLGDSLIDFGPWEELLPGHTVRKRGIAGDFIEGFTARLDEVASQKPDAIVIIGGCNSLVKWPESTPETVWSAYETLLSRLRELLPDTPLFVESVLPLSPKDAGEYEGFNDKAEALNAFLEKNQSRFAYRYLDLASLVRDARGDLREDLTPDGCHLTLEGYRIWADQLRPELEAVLKRD